MPIAYIHMYLCISTDCILGLEKKKKEKRKIQDKERKKT